MIIHVVENGETISEIAQKYNISVARLIESNGLINPNDLVVGQTIVIVYPAEIYTVEDGDTLESIANKFDVTVLQLLRNNPFLSDREYIYPGESLVISYNTNSDISINGYAYPFISEQTLKKTLPYLTYLTIFNYRTEGPGQIVGENDSEMIALTKEYSVAPIMSLSTLTYQGVGDVNVVNSILYDIENQMKHIDRILEILNSKGYYGLNVSIVHLDSDNRDAYENYISNLASRLKKEGYILFVTISPRIIVTSNEITFDKINYEKLGSMVDGFFLLSYAWGYSVGPPSPTTPLNVVRVILDYIITQVPPDKIYLGLSIIGYDWELPYIVGVSKANSLSTDAAIELAANYNATILFDVNSRSPYFQYYDDSTSPPTWHIVWFKDARSIDSLVNLVPEYGIQGISIWNTMSHFPQMWLVINSQYNITKVLPEY
jgi:spore germination protein